MTQDESSDCTHSEGFIFVGVNSQINEFEMCVVDSTVYQRGQSLHAVWEHLQSLVVMHACNISTSAMFLDKTHQFASFLLLWWDEQSRAEKRICCPTINMTYYDQDWITNQASAFFFFFNHDYYKSVSCHRDIPKQIKRGTSSSLGGDKTIQNLV